MSDHLLPLGLIYFRDVARMGSISAAAGSQRVVPSAVSRQIVKLENHLRVSLFERHPRGMALTEAGRRLLTHVRRAERDASSMMDELATSIARKYETVTIACSDGFAHRLVPQAIAQVREKHDYLRVRMDVVASEEATRRVFTDHADIAATYSVSPTEGVRVEYSSIVPLFAVVPSAHELAQRTEVSLREALDYPYAVLRANSSQEQLVANAAHKHGLELRPVMECDRSVSLLEFTKLGGGISFSSAIGVRKAIGPGVVLIPLTDPEFSQRSAQLQTAPWKTPSEAQFDLLEAMIEAMKRHSHGEVQQAD